MLNDALEHRCSDIHIFLGKGSSVVVKFRVAGVLSNYVEADGIGLDLVRRIKALARMDLAESRLPQDGSFHWESETAQCDVRVSTLPTIHGEAVVMRLFPEQRGSLDFTSLGMNRSQSQDVLHMLGHTSGLILVTGPINSGKTTTLYAMMLQLARMGRKVISIEDPVEMPVADCQQVEVRERVGVTFDVGLRALLRHDPDVIMIGEIRDEGSAQAAVRAALTGHLVLSTTHAPDAVGAMVRLVEFNVPRSLLATVMRGIVVQAFPPSHKPRAVTGTARERHPLFGVVPITPVLAECIAADTPWYQVRSQLLQSAVAEGRQV
jgi:type II secretory ATPase GspE/PulE/Tfp pilus assembly ATPase PilB-like protein